MSDYVENLAQPRRLSAAAAMTITPRSPCTERLGRVRTPALVIMGTKDPDFDPIAEGKCIATQTGGKLEMIDGAGYYPQTEMPEKTAPLIIDFLKMSV